LHDDADTISASEAAAIASAVGQAEDTPQSTTLKSNSSKSGETLATKKDVGDAKKTVKDKA